MNEYHLRNFDLNLLLTLHILLEERSVTRAARRLSVSQSAVSHSLTRLRKAFNDNLLTRTEQAMIPTARALAISDEVKTLLVRVGQLVAEPVFDASRYSGVFRMTVTDYGAMLVIPELAAYLARTAPGLRLECEVWNDQTLQRLDGGSTDLALGGQVPFPKFRNEPLFRDRLTLMVDENHPLATRRRINIEEFLRYPHAVISVVATRMKVIDEKLAARKKARRIALSLPHFLTAPEVLRGSEMILTIPEVGARRVLERGGLRLLPLPFAVPSYDYIQVWSGKRDRDPVHGWMRQAIRQICARHF